tara:strand:+ start:124 stop:363 length:240 start_codon:yes stop_codon:yes gene_type:complete
MKITQKRLRQLIKEELDAMSGGMDPRNAIIGAFEGIPTEKMVIALNAIADLDLSSMELKQIALDLSQEVSAGDGSVMMR